MIQSVLFFLLGFLCAGFLALMVAPAVWRRALVLTRKRIEASVPLSPAEIQADKDRLRAEFAMSTRRLEMGQKTLRDKATAQMIEIDRNREQLRQLAAQHAERAKAAAESEARGDELRTDLSRREGQIRQLGDKLAEVERMLEQRTLDMDKLGRMYDEATLISSKRQIELVARESEVDKLAGDVSLISSERKDNDRRLHEVVAENKVTRTALEVATLKVDDLEKELERLMASLADRDEKLDGRERELVRLREKIRDSMRKGKDVEPVDNDEARTAANGGGPGMRMSVLHSGASGGDTEKTVAMLKEDRDRLEARLTALTRTNRKLRTDLASQGRSKSEAPDDGNALLRDEIYDLAAEMVSMTAALEGPESPIGKALAVPAPEADPRDKITSLADRVKALQKSAPTS